MALIPKFITGISSGLQKNKKPFLLPDQAWQTLENAFVWRERVKKRNGVKFLGRLRREVTNISLAVTDGTAVYNNPDILSSFRPTEPNAELQCGSVEIVIDLGGANETIYEDVNGDGVLVMTSGVYTISSGYVIYTTGQVVLNFTVIPPLGTTVTANIQYFPALPCMGIHLRDIFQLNDEQTLWFDQHYAYAWNGSGFDEFIPGTAWDSTDSDFFQACNYRGAAPQDKLFFVTNFVSTAANPMRYTDGATWTNFVPLITANDSLFSCRILVPYYGRLLALNCWEGLTAGGAGGAVNIQNRCRFSQLGSPIHVDAWRGDIFGKGGLIDAPTAEAIVGAIFVKNTLVVQFEQTTWQLRYVGEYGMPFIWERISSDFGSESTFSQVLFENQMLSVGDKAITASNGTGSDRIDLDIPDQVFEIENENDGVKRVWGARDYRNEIVYWCYPDSNTEAAPGVNIKFPNKVLTYNYRTGAWSVFRDNVTAFGKFQLSEDLTWDSTDVYWDDYDVFWDSGENQALFPSVTGGNQQGFIFLYNWQLPDQQTLFVQDIDLTTNPITVTSPDHNLQNEEVIQINDMHFIDSVTFLPVATDLNGQLFGVHVIDQNTFGLLKLDPITKQYVYPFPFTPTTPVIYAGCGNITIFPRLNVITKDFGLYQDKGLQTKISHIDFLVEVTSQAQMTINLLLNASTSVVGNILVGNKNMSSAPTNTFYPPATTSDYAWYSFYATTVGQFCSINITYSNELMNLLETHAQAWTLLGINAWTRPGGGLTQ
jgi:hypothetical protein